MNAVIQCGVVPDIAGMGLLSHNWNVRAPCAAFMMSFLTFCWSSKQMTYEMMSGLFPKVTYPSNPEVSMVIDHAKFFMRQPLVPTRVTLLNLSFEWFPMLRLLPSFSAHACSRRTHCYSAAPIPHPCPSLLLFSHRHLPLPCLCGRITNMLRGGYVTCNQRRSEVSVNIAAAAAIDLKRQAASAGESAPKSSTDARKASART